MRQLSTFARRRYTSGFTPIEPLDRLSDALGGPRIYVKRDDLLGLAAGGNKTRKLEFLVAEALSAGCDGLITCGAVQSNHCRLTAAAAAREGMTCHLVIEERVPESYSRTGTGNNFLFHLLGVESITLVASAGNVEGEMEALRERLARQGRSMFVIPGGGSNATGALGYVACLDEILAQSFDAGLDFSAVVCASGSGGTHAGLLAGSIVRSGPPIFGVSVRFDRATQEARIRALTAATLERLEWHGEVPSSAVVVDDAAVGPGYSIPTGDMVDTVRLLARTEGVLLDPVYTGKAMAGLIRLVQAGAFDPRSNVLFVHTGGQPALFAYQDVLDPGTVG